MKTSLFIKGNVHKRFKVNGLIDSNMTKKEIEELLETFGFYMFSVEETR